MKPSFWSDAKLAELSDAVRLFYVGLWMIADDSGYLRTDLSEIAGELYRYEPRGRRERHSAAAFDVLQEHGRVRVLDCGVHAVIPKFREHQHPSKPVTTVEKEHTRDCPRISAEARGFPHGEGEGKREGEGEGKRAGARANGGAAPREGELKAHLVALEPRLKELA